MLNQDEKWLLEEKYQGEESAPVFNESLDEIKNKYSWGEDFCVDCKRLAEGEPLGYVIGHVPFLDCEIHLDSKPLIPRVETEFWTEKAIVEIKKVLDNLTTRSVRVLDLCAGSGAVGVAVLKHTSASVDFAEIDKNHHATINKNIRQNSHVAGPNSDDFKSSNRLFEGNLFEKIADKYDFILSNPPYIDKKLNRTSDSVRKYEPHLALFAENDGMELVSRIINQAQAYLNESGQLWIEHEPEQLENIKKLAQEAGYVSYESCFDQYGIARYSVLKSS